MVYHFAFFLALLAFVVCCGVAWCLLLPVGMVVDSVTCIHGLLVWALSVRCSVAAIVGGFAWFGSGLWWLPSWAVLFWVVVARLLRVLGLSVVFGSGFVFCGFVGCLRWVRVLLMVSFRAGLCGLRVVDGFWAILWFWVASLASVVCWVGGLPVWLVLGCVGWFPG